MMRCIGKYRLALLLVIAVATLLYTISFKSVAVPHSPMVFVERITSTLPDNHESKSTKDSINSSIAEATSTKVQSRQLRYYDPLYHEQSKRSVKPQHGTQACNIPGLNPWDSRILKLVKNINTKPTKWDHPPFLTYIWNRTHIRINSSNEHFYANGTASKCQVSFLNREENDKTLKWSEKIPLKPGTGLSIPPLEQYMIVRCGNWTKKWTSQRVHIRFVVNPKVAAKLETQKKKRRQLSVLMFYNDGIGHAMSRRVMNETYYYLRNEQGGISLNRYHSVGLNSFPNMIPYLTGKGDLEFDWNIRKALMNLVPLIWKNFSNNSYVTGFMEDSYYSTFNYAKKGFSSQPTDYYLKNILNLIENLGVIHSKSTKSKDPNFYLQQTMLHILDDFLSLHKDSDYFFLWFLNRLSHYNPFSLGRADNDYYRFFKRHFDAGTFKNTLLIFGSDHGARFGAFRGTSLGRMEERLPLQLLVFPKWFKNEYKEIYEMLQYNAENALTTPFDMYRTLRDILDQKKVPMIHKRSVNGTLLRGLSLFGEIPMSRTCQDAGIPPSFCICDVMTPIDVGNANVTESTKTAINHINNKLLKAHKKKCEILKLQKIDTALYREGKSAKQETYHEYFIRFVVAPGGAILEATVRYLNSSQTYTVQGNIGRINLYGTTSKCIDSDLLKSYCYCKNQE